MTIRSRPVKHSRRSRLSGLFEDEARQQLTVTVFFILAIVVVLLILVGAFALSWYNDNLRPLAQVGSVEVGPQLLKEDVAFEQWRISRDQSRITQAQIDGTLDTTTAQQMLSDLDTQSTDLATTGLDNFVDLIYQSQLAADQGITVADADVDQRLLEEVSAPEQRHVLAIFVEPQAADPTTGPTAQEANAARDKASAALAALQAGQPFADVAAQYSTDPSAQNGGDYGTLTKGLVSDPDWGDALFKLPLNGITAVILGSDGVYRIGEVTQITPGAEEPGQRASLFQAASEQDVRQFLRYQIASDGLKDKIVSDALAQTPEQAHIAGIYIDGLYSGDPSSSTGDEIDYAEIVFSPNNDPTNAPTLSADDPAWAQALQDANTAMDQLKAITDPDTLKSTFTTMATNQSDSGTAQDGGEVGFVTADIPDPAVSDALFNSDHQENDLIGPVKADDGYHILLFHSKRPPSEQRVQAVQDALAQPGADFATVAKQLSEGPEKDSGGEIGWVLQDDLDPTLADQIFGLSVGQISDPLEVGNGHYIIKMEDKGPRALDPDQQSNARGTAFDTWYTTQLDNAKANGTVVVAGETPVPTLDAGGDQSVP